MLHGQSLYKRTNLSFYKLPHLGCFSTIAQSKIRRLVNRYCHDLDIKLVFTTFKLRNLFSVKDSVSRELRSRVIYKFTCACYNVAISAKLVVIFPHASVNISLQTSPLTSSNIYEAQNVVVNLALRIVSKSLIPPLLNINLNSRRLCI